MIDFPGDAVFDADGVWAQVLRAPNAQGLGALFVDRDGVLVEEVGYLSRPSDVRLIPGATKTVARANGVGMPVVVVTNQAGIAYGSFDWDAFSAVQERIIADLAAAGAFVNGVFACPFHAEGKPPYDHPDHPARKPTPGMLSRAGTLLHLDLPGSWMIGDRAQDLAAASNAGLAGGIHVLTGHGGDSGEREAALALAGPGFQVSAVESIADAGTILPFDTSGHGLINGGAPA